MDKKTIYTAFSLPILLALFGIFKLNSSSDPGFGSIANVGFIILAFIWAIILGVILFLLRSKNLVWWYGLLISLGSIIASIGIFILVFS